MWGWGRTDGGTHGSAACFTVCLGCFGPNGRRNARQFRMFYRMLGLLSQMSVSGQKIAGKIEAIAVVFTRVFETDVKIEAFITAIAGVFASIFMDKSRAGTGACGGWSNFGPMRAKSDQKSANPNKIAFSWAVRAHIGPKTDHDLPRKNTSVQTNTVLRTDRH